MTSMAETTTSMALITTQKVTITSSTIMAQIKEEMLIHKWTIIEDSDQQCKWEAC